MACEPVWGPATALVAASFDHYTTLGTTQVAAAMAQVDAMRHIEMTPITFNNRWHFEEDITGYKRPPKPADPKDLDWTDPGSVKDPPALDVSTVSFDAPPTAPSNPTPTFGVHHKPGPLSAHRPGDKPDLVPVVLPTPPTLALPPVPTLRELQLPDTPTLNLTPFAGVRPNVTVAPPVQGFAFTPEAYASQLLDRVKSRLSTMLDGGTGLPAAVAQALRDRAYAALDVQEQRAIQQAVEEFAARGFSEPNGILARALVEVRQNNQNQRSARSRDIHIKDEELAIQNLQFAVTQGISLESTLMQHQAEHNRLLLDAAKTAQDMAIAIFNAAVAEKQLELDAYKTDAQVWLDGLKGELAKLDVLKAELEAQALVGQLNESDVKVYLGRLDAVKTAADVYRSEVEGAKAAASVNESLMRGWQAEIQAFSEEVRAWVAEWDGYRAELEGDSTRARLFELVEQAYATRVSTWNMQQMQKIERQRSEIARNGQMMAGWEAQLRKLQADTELERTKNTVKSEIFRTKVARYQAEAAVETAAADANARAYGLQLERERSRTSLELERARSDSQQMVQLTQQLISINEIISRTLTALASSALSAVNYSASVGNSYGTNTSCSTSYSYQPDA